jgi:hypothetical protein
VISTLAREEGMFIYGNSEPGFTTDPFFLRHVDAYRTEMTLLIDPDHQQKMRTDPAAQAIKQALDQGSRNLKTLADAGVTIGLGTDTGTNGQAGLLSTGDRDDGQASLAMQALVAQRRPSRRVNQQLGSIAPGKQADLLVLNADPLVDIRNTEDSLRGLAAGGRQDVRNRAESRPPRSRWEPACVLVWALAWGPAASPRSSRHRLRRRRSGRGRPARECHSRRGTVTRPLTTWPSTWRTRRRPATSRRRRASTCAANRTTT